MIYVAAPYTYPNPDVVKMRMRKFAEVMTNLIESDQYPVSPLLNHFLIDQVPTKFPTTWDFWHTYSTLLLTSCKSMVVIMTDPEWETSPGVQAEIKLAEYCNIPISYINKIDLG